MSNLILGISAFYHDSASALLCEGEIIAAAHEERFTRTKHDSSFPLNAVQYVMKEAGIDDLGKLCAVAFYDKPYIKFERLLETYHAFAPKGLKSFVMSMPVWIKEKLFLKDTIKNELSKIVPGKTEILFPEHHLSHAASAFYPSPFEKAAILTIDGVGEWSTTTIADGEGAEITILKELHFPHSIGLLYSAFTYYCGFKVNSGEYKLMGLAPYGDHRSDQTKRFKKLILENIVDIRSDGSLLLNMDFFGFATDLTMCHDEKWKNLFEIPKRNPETEISQSYMNMALAIQEITEDVVVKLADTAKTLTGRDYLVLAGGVALNCVANGKILRTGKFKDIWIQPAAGDAGGALGAAYAAWHIWKQKERNTSPGTDCMKGAYLGPEYCDNDAMQMTRKYRAKYLYYQEYDKLCDNVADLLNEGNVVGWFQGKMEYGPRALGNRSILGDARQPEMQKKLNLKIKYREGFRPFAPSVLEEDIQEYFDLDRPSPYMLLVAPVRNERRRQLPDDYTNRDLLERLYFLRSDIPAVTHIDFSARIQSVNKDVNYRYWRLINIFKEKTGYGIIVNTSFNVRGEPIVCSPEDAYICFMRTEMDYLVIGNFLFAKNEQNKWKDDSNWKNQYVLD